MEILALMFLPAIIFIVLGIILLVAKKRTAGLIFIILGVVYVIISVGICASLLSSFSLH
jgi:membrane protein implicated in regulation of membrane protease activity